MTVYVDDMQQPAKVAGARPAIWSHLMADTSEELQTFAQRIGLNPRWLQHAGTYREHYDLTDTYRRVAIRNGAQEISYPRGTAEVLARKREAR